MKDKITLTPKQIEDAILSMALPGKLDKPLTACLNRLFESGAWEIPDDAVKGEYAHKIDQLVQQNESLLELVTQLAKEVRGEVVKPAGRVDAVAAAKKK